MLQLAFWNLRAGHAKSQTLKQTKSRILETCGFSDNFPSLMKTCTLMHQAPQNDSNTDTLDLDYLPERSNLRKQDSLDSDNLHCTAEHQKAI